MGKTKCMKKATYRDREKAVDILCQAFTDILIPNSINFGVKNVVLIFKTNLKLCLFLGFI